MTVLILSRNGFIHLKKTTVVNRSSLVDQSFSQKILNFFVLISIINIQLNFLLAMSLIFFFLYAFPEEKIESRLLCACYCPEK